MSDRRARAAGRLAIVACGITVALIFVAMLTLIFGDMPAARTFLIMAGVACGIAFVLIIIMFVNAPPERVRRWRVRRQFRREAQRQRRPGGIQRWH